MSQRLAPAAVFVGFALTAGILQVIATLMLGLARVDRLHAAASEGSSYYVLGALGTGLGLLVMWLLRRRPMIASIAFFVWELVLVFTLGSRTTSLGLAYHGEYILHHFAAIVSAAACVATGVAWVRRLDLGGSRLLPAGLALVGGVALLAAHVLPQPGVDLRTSGSLAEAAAALALLAPITALAVFWRKTSNAAFRHVSVALLVPIVLRVALAWPEGLSGGSVPDGIGRTILVVSIIAAAGVTFTLFRPEAPRPIKVVVAALSGLGTALLYLVYRRAFGELEDGIGGLAQSLFGFPLPYPNYVPGWQVFIVAVAIFFVFATVYAGLMSWNERVRGVTLGLLAVSGIGLSNPQLVLMVVAAHLLWIDLLVQGVAREPARAPPSSVEDTLAAIAEAMHFPAPVVLETARGSVIALRGDLDGTSVDLRARPGRGDAWEIVLETGVVGRGRAGVELLPDAGDGGDRPEHPIAATHRVQGSMRALELLGDGPLDALRVFPDVRARFWTAGAKIEFGRDLGAFDRASVRALLEALGG